MQGSCRNDLARMPRRSSEHWSCAMSVCSRTEQSLCFHSLGHLQEQELRDLPHLPSQVLPLWMPVSLCWIHVKSQQIPLEIQDFLNTCFPALVKSPPFWLVCVLDETRHEADAPQTTFSSARAPHAFLQAHTKVLLHLWAVLSTQDAQEEAECCRAARAGSAMEFPGTSRPGAHRHQPQRSPGLGSGPGIWALLTTTSISPGHSHTFCPASLLGIPLQCPLVLLQLTPPQKHFSAGMGNQLLSVYAVSGPWETCRHYHWTRCGVEVCWSGNKVQACRTLSHWVKPHKVLSTHPKQSASTTGSPGPTKLHRGKRDNLLHTKCIYQSPLNTTAEALPELPPSSSRPMQPQGPPKWMRGTLHIRTVSSPVCTHHQSQHS